MNRHNLYLFPALPNKNSGYEWAVKSDITRLNINDSDYIVLLRLKITPRLKRVKLILIIKIISLKMILSKNINGFIHTIRTIS